MGRKKSSSQPIPLPALPSLNGLEESAKKELRGYELPEDRCPETNALPDYLQAGLDIVFIGINPGLVAGKVGRYYPGSGNHFWKCVYHSGVITEALGPPDDFTLPSRFKVGFTEIVRRTTRVAKDLNKRELAEGAESLRERLAEFVPRIAAFNGKEIYRIFSGKKDFSFGLQPEPVAQGCPTRIFVLPSSSARCTQLPRYTDKVPYYAGLAKLRDHLVGLRELPTEEELVFPGQLPSPPKRPAGASPSKTPSKTPSKPSPAKASPSPMTMDAIKPEALDSLLNTASAQGTPPHPHHDDQNPQGQTPFSSSGDPFGSGGNPIFSHNPLLSSTNTPSPTEGMGSGGQGFGQASDPSTSQAAAAPAQAAPLPTAVDPALIEAHIMESVAAVVERCKNGSLVIPDHYIRPSDIPASKRPGAIHAQGHGGGHHGQSHHKGHGHQAHQPLPAHHQPKQRQAPAAHRQPAQQQQRAAHQQQGGAQGAQAVLETYLTSAPYLAGQSQQVYNNPAAAAMQQVQGFPADFYNAYLRQGVGQQPTTQAQPQTSQQQHFGQASQAYTNAAAAAVNPYAFMYQQQPNGNAQQPHQQQQHNNQHNY